MSEPNSLNEVSMLLGKLLQQTETLTSQTAELNRSITTLQKNSTDTLTTLERISSRVTVIEVALDHNILPNIEDYKKLRNRGWGILVAIGFASTSLGAFGSRIAKALFGE